MKAKPKKAAQTSTLHPEIIEIIERKRLELIQKFQANGPEPLFLDGKLPSSSGIEDLSLGKLASRVREKLSAAREFAALSWPEQVQYLQDGHESPIDEAYFWSYLHELQVSESQGREKSILGDELLNLQHEVRLTRINAQGNEELVNPDMCFVNVQDILPQYDKICFGQSKSLAEALRSALDLAAMQSDNLRQDLGLGADMPEIISDLTYCPSVPVEVMAGCLALAKEKGLVALLRVLHQVNPDCFDVYEQDEDLWNDLSKSSDEELYAYIRDYCCGFDEIYGALLSADNPYDGVPHLLYTFGTEERFLWRLALHCANVVCQHSMNCFLMPPHAAYLLGREFFLDVRHNESLPLPHAYQMIEYAALCGHPLAVITLGLFCGSLDLTQAPSGMVAFIYLKGLMYWQQLMEWAQPYNFVDCPRYYQQDGKVYAIEAELLYNTLSAIYQQARTGALARQDDPDGEDLYPETFVPENPLFPSILSYPLEQTEFWRPFFTYMDSLRGADRVRLEAMWGLIWHEHLLPEALAFTVAFRVETFVKVEPPLPLPNALQPLYQELNEKLKDESEHLRHEHLEPINLPDFIYLSACAALLGDEYALETVIYLCNHYEAKLKAKYKKALLTCTPQVQALAESGHAAALEFMFRQAKDDKKLYWVQKAQENWAPWAFIPDTQEHDASWWQVPVAEQIKRARYLWQCGYAAAGVTLYTLLAQVGRQAEARAYLLLAHLSGVPLAATLMGALDPDEGEWLAFAKVLRKLELAAQQGYAPACNQLAALYYIGAIVPLDRHQAEHWVRMRRVNYDFFDTAQAHWGSGFNNLVSHHLSNMRRLGLQGPYAWDKNKNFDEFIRAAIVTSLSVMGTALIDGQTLLERELLITLINQQWFLDQISYGFDGNNYVCRLDGKTVVPLHRGTCYHLLLKMLNLRYGLTFQDYQRKEQQIDKLPFYLFNCSEYLVLSALDGVDSPYPQDFFLRGLVALRSVSMPVNLPLMKHYMLLASNAGMMEAPLFYHLRTAMWQAPLGMAQEIKTPPKTPKSKSKTEPEQKSAHQVVATAIA